MDDVNNVDTVDTVDTVDNIKEYLIEYTYNGCTTFPCHSIVNAKTSEEAISKLLVKRSQGSLKHFRSLELVHIFNLTDIREKYSIS